MKIKTCIVWGVLSIFLFFSNQGASPEKESDPIIIETKIPEINLASADEIEEATEEEPEQEPDPEEKREVIELTYEEAQLLMKIAQAEAGNQGEEGMWLVMSVVINRKNDEAFPDTVKEVAYQKNCFATVTTGKINKVELSLEAHTALARIEKGEVKPDIVGFENKSNNSLERYFDFAFTYLDHNFYTNKK